MVIVCIHRISHSCVATVTYVGHQLIVTWISMLMTAASSDTTNGNFWPFVENEMESSISVFRLVNRLRQNESRKPCKPDLKLLRLQLSFPQSSHARLCVGVLLHPSAPPNVPPQYTFDNNLFPSLPTTFVLLIERGYGNPTQMSKPFVGNAVRRTKNNVLLT